MVNLRFTIPIGFFLYSIYTFLSHELSWADIVPIKTKVRTIHHRNSPEKQIREKRLGLVCFENRRGDRDSFVISGRGGLPDNPSEPTVSKALWQDLRPLPLSDDRQTSNDLISPPQTSQILQFTPASKVEAQGWVFSPNGTVTLVADATSPNLSQFMGKTCMAPAQNSERNSANTKGAPH